MKKKLFLLNEKGAAAVEFAIVLIPLLMIVFGGIEFGLLMYNKQVITNASREGARAGIVARENYLTVEQIKAVVNNYCNNFLISFGSDNTLETTVTYSEQKSFEPITVRVTYDYRFLILSNFIPSLSK
ncbi:MAG: pilus assembly protein, partial [Desulfuromonadaceae bacterium]|nr:pilus assembly protein [Desulfuromonadaceae bacterium]